MRTVEINRSDWTGRTVKVRISDRRQTVALDGSTFTLSMRTADMFNIRSSEHGDTVIGWVARMSDNVWLAKSEFCDLTREDADPFLAVAKLMCNI